MGVTNDQLVTAFKTMREGVGMSEDKLAIRTDLLRAFNLLQPREFIDMVRVETEDLLDDPHCRAGLVALAIGFPPLKDLRTRRLRGAGEDLSADYAIARIRNQENKGFVRLAERLVQVADSKGGSLSLEDRVDSLMRLTFMLRDRVMRLEKQVADLKRSM